MKSKNKKQNAKNFRHTSITILGHNIPRCLVSFDHKKKIITIRNFTFHTPEILFCDWHIRFISCCFPYGLYGTNLYLDTSIQNIKPLHPRIKDIPLSSINIIYS